MRGQDFRFGFLAPGLSGLRVSGLRAPELEGSSLTHS